MANGPIATILARLGDCISLGAELAAKHLNACAAPDAEVVRAQHEAMIAGLSDVRTQLQDALAGRQSKDGLSVDDHLNQALKWLEKGVDSEVWNTMRVLADEVNRLRPLAEASTSLAQRERAFAKNCERVMAGMEVEVAAITKAKRDVSAEVDRLTAGLNRIATDYDYSAAGKVAKQILGISDAIVPGALPEVQKP